MIELKVTGMTCGGCVNSVRRAVARVMPEANPDIDLASGRFALVLADGDLDAIRAQLIAAIEAAGFGAEAPKS
jgi:copper chaperone